MPYERELQAALEACDQAGRAVLTAYEQFTPIPDAPADIATDADRQAQEIILSHLRTYFPNDALCAEETTPTLEAAEQTGARLWIVDPIDGTRGFARKTGEFSLMIGFVENGTVQVGVVYEPAHQRLTYAVRGGGCWRRDGDAASVLCRVSTTDELTLATLTQSRSKNPSVPSQPVQALHPKKVLETYSAGIKLALVARGEADLYVNTYAAFHDWDICAGHLLVDEAGGKVTGLWGQELRYGLPGAWQRHGVLATNGHFHQAAVEALRGLDMMG